MTPEETLQKYEAFKAEYERLLSPVAGPITQGFQSGDYKPAEPVDDLIRYVYTVAKLSHERRDLIIAMTQAYMELPPNRPELRGNDYPSSVEQLGYPILHALNISMRAILMQKKTLFVDLGFIDGWTVTLLADGLVWTIYNAPEDGAPIIATRQLCVPLLVMLLPGEDWAGLDDRIKRVVGAS